MLASSLSCSVIVPTYNRAKLLGKTLKSLLVDAQGDTDFEVVVVDDGSSDHTFDVVKSFQQYGRIKYVFQPDAGYRVARARNLAIAISEGQICIFTDAGIAVASGFVQSHLNTHRQHNNSVVLGPVLGIYSKTQEDLEWLEGQSNNAVDSYLDAILANRNLEDPRQPGFDICGGDLNRLPLPWAYGWTSNISMPRKQIIAAGGFDENYTSWGVEDLDLSLSLYKRGLNFTLANDATAIHIPHPMEEHKVTSNLKNRRYLHNKFQMKETELWLNRASYALNFELKSAR